MADITPFVDVSPPAIVEYTEVFPLAEPTVVPEVLPWYVTAGGVVTFHMAVWNTTNSNWVRWTVTGSPDTAGASYPGPGTFGVDTQTPAFVESVVVT